MMNISIQCRGFSLTEALDNHVQQRLGFALARAGNRLRRVDVRLSDINGPRGGVDKRCLIEARLSGKTIVVEEVQADLYAAIDRAAGRIGRTVLRRLALGANNHRPIAAMQPRNWAPEM
jgi:ribosomal subunit interface protein